MLLSWHYFFCTGESTLPFLIVKLILEVEALLDSRSWHISAGCWVDTPEQSLGQYFCIVYISRMIAENDTL